MAPVGTTAVTVEEVMRAQRAEGPATVLAIGTATPDNCVSQADYADYYFRVTKSEHLVDLKKKFKRMCKQFSIRIRSSPNQCMQNGYHPLNGQTHAMLVIPRNG